MTNDFLKKIKEVFNNFISFARRRFFIIYLILLFIVFCLAGIIFYWYSFKLSVSAGKSSFKEVKINHQLFQKINSRFEENKKLFEKSAISAIPDPFK